MSINWSPDFKSFKENAKHLTPEDHKALDEMWSPGAVTMRMVNAVERAEKDTRARTLAECKAAVEEIERKNTHFDYMGYDTIAMMKAIIALFDKGGPLDPGSEGE